MEPIILSRHVVMLEAKVRTLEEQLRQVKGESWRARLKAEKMRLEQEMDLDHYFFYHTLDMGLNCIIRGTLELRSVIDVDEDEAVLAEALLDDLLALIHKHRRPATMERTGTLMGCRYGKIRRAKR